MKRVFIALSALSLSLSGLGIWHLQTALAQTQVNWADTSELKQLTQLAKQELQQHHYEKAISTLQKVLYIAQKLHLKEAEATTLSKIGWVYHDIGQPQKALEYYTQVLPIIREVKNRRWEAETLNNIGIFYQTIGQPQKALEYYTQALFIGKEIKDRRLEAKILDDIGEVYRAISQRQKALEYYTQALSIIREVKYRRGEARTLNHIGEVYRAIGQPQKALEYYTQALPITREVKDRSGEAKTLNNIGTYYQSVGQPQKALEYYTQALPIIREVKYRREGARTLNNIGEAYRAIGQPQKALEYYTQALPITREVKDRSGEAKTLNNIGTYYQSIGQPQKALEYYTQALLITREVKDRREEIETLSNIGRGYSNLDQPQKALEYYNLALLIGKEIKDRSREAIALKNLISLERSQGNLRAAQAHVESAIKIIETIRAEIISQEFRASFFATRQDYYNLHIDILMQLHKQQPSKGFNALALQASERARARSLIELLNESQADIHQGVDPKLLEQEKKLQFQLNALERRRVELYSKTPTKEQTTLFEKEYDTLLSQSQDLKAQIRSRSPRYAALTQPQPLTLSEIQQQVLDKNTALLEYFIGKDRSYLWAVTPSGITSHELPKQAEIEAASEKFRKIVSNPNVKLTEMTQAGKPLTQVLLGPVAKQLSQKRLLIAGHGALQYIPFAALPSPSGSQFLLTDHEIISLPSASTLATLRKETSGRKSAAKSVAIFADPVFSSSDQRVMHRESKSTTQPKNVQDTEPFSIQTLRQSSQEAGIKFERLPGTRQEAKDILQLLPAQMRTQALDFEANKVNVLKFNLAQYRVVHFATHGILSTTRPERSAVVLSLVDPQGRLQNGFLSLNDIFNLNLPAELVVLSACQTGLGQNVRGEGLIGLTRGFMYAGAPRVLVSLWNVNDESTAVLMKHFYQAMLGQKLAPAAALRSAQLQLLKHPKWNNPYHWAAFTLQGEWK